MSFVSFATVQARNLIVLHGKCYDLKDFDHPGGFEILRPLLGHDGTFEYNKHHSKDFLALAEKFFVGQIDASDPLWRADVEEQKKKNVSVAVASSSSSSSSSPSLESMLNASDFKAVAEQVMAAPGLAYYESGANSEASLRENEAVFDRFWIRPRVLVDVSRVDISTTILGSASKSPIYVTATALARLAHPDGEVAIVRACHRTGTVYMLPTLSSCSLDEMVAARAQNQPLWFQLYVNPNRSLTEQVVRKAEQLGCSGLFVTVDAPQLGRRERDMRFKAVLKPDLQKNVKVDDKQGTTRALSSFIDPTLTWRDLPWLSSLSKMPLVLKGIQTGEDALIAVRDFGCKGLVLSNHGGRQQDYCRSGTEILIEVVDVLKKNGLRDRVQIFVDGGIRRGSDVFKLLCLGADGVGIGRPVLHALAAFGEDGVTRLLQLLQDELKGCFEQCGVQNMSQINSSFIISRSKL